MWSACSMLVSGMNTWPPTGSGRPPATDSVAPAMVMAIHNSGERKVRGFIIYPIGLRLQNALCIRVLFWNWLLTRECYGAASIYHDRLKRKLNQSKWVVFNYDFSFNYDYNS